MLASLHFMYLFGAVVLVEGSVFGQGGDTAQRFACNSVLALFAALDAGLMVLLLAWHGGQQQPEGMQRRSVRAHAAHRLDAGLTQLHDALG